MIFIAGIYDKLIMYIFMGGETDWRRLRRKEFRGILISQNAVNENELNQEIIGNLN